MICVPVLIELEVGTGYTAGTGTDYTYILLPPTGKYCRRDRLLEKYEELLSLR